MMGEWWDIWYITNNVQLCMIIREPTCSQNATPTWNHNISSYLIVDYGHSHSHSHSSCPTCHQGSGRFITRGSSTALLPDHNSKWHTSRWSSHMLQHSPPDPSHAVLWSSDPALCWCRHPGSHGKEAMMLSFHWRAAKEDGGQHFILNRILSMDSWIDTQHGFTMVTVLLFSNFIHMGDGYHLISILDTYRISIRVAKGRPVSFGWSCLMSIT